MPTNDWFINVIAEHELKVHTMLHILSKSEKGQKKKKFPEWKKKINWKETMTSRNVESHVHVIHAMQVINKYISLPSNLEADGNTRTIGVSMANIPPPIIIYVVVGMVIS